MSIKSKILKNAIEDGDHCETIFQIIDQQVNNIVDENGNHDNDKAGFIGLASKAASEDFDMKGGNSDLVAICKKMNIDASPELISFHFGFQYGFSVGGHTDKIINEISSILRGESDGESDEIDETLIKDERLANITIDREAGFLQLKVGNKLITCKNIESVDIIEL